MPLLLASDATTDRSLLLAVRRPFSLVGRAKVDRRRCHGQVLEISRTGVLQSMKVALFEAHHIPLGEGRYLASFQQQLLTLCPI